MDEVEGWCSMTLTVEFKIHPDGHCPDCEARYAGVCRAFGKFAFKRPCAECNDYREHAYDPPPPRPEVP